LIGIACTVFLLEISTVHSNEIYDQETMFCASCDVGIERDRLVVTCEDLGIRAGCVEHREDVVDEDIIKLHKYPTQQKALHDSVIKSGPQQHCPKTSPMGNEDDGTPTPPMQFGVILGHSAYTITTPKSGHKRKASSHSARRT
jgi:hypothetical protein